MIAQAYVGRVLLFRRIEKYLYKSNDLLYFITSALKYFSCQPDIPIAKHSASKLCKKRNSVLPFLWFLRWPFLVPLGQSSQRVEQKKTEKQDVERKAYLTEQLTTEKSRQAYFTAIDAKRTELKDYMKEEEQKYQALLATQKDTVAGHQRIATRTTTQSVVKKQTVQVAAKPSSASSKSSSSGSTKSSAAPSVNVATSAPKAATKTKTS